MQSPVRLIAIFCASSVIWAILGLVFGLLVNAPGFGLICGLAAAVGYWFMSAWAADKFALELYGAKLVNKTNAPHLYEMVGELSVDFKIDPPLIYSTPDPHPNAFTVALPQRSTAIVLTNGLTKKLTREEVRAIIILMIARIASGDTEAQTIAATLAGIPLYGVCGVAFRERLRAKIAVETATGITTIEKILLSVLIPPCSVIYRIAFNRKAFMAIDRKAVEIIGDPAILDSALMKIESDLPTIPWTSAPYNPATAVLFAVPPFATVQGLQAMHPFFTRAQIAFSGGVPSVAERRGLLQPPKEVVVATARVE